MKPHGLIIYSGPSQLDGKPIVAIANGIGRKSRNIKTGAMIQVWILRRDVSPLEAIRTGADRSICGDCPLRGLVKRAGRRLKNILRRCYVRVDVAPLAVYRAYRAGSYERYDESKHAHLFSGRKIRLGAYGDPCALPYSLVSSILRYSDGWTGYTHQWRRGDLWRWRRIVMASADSADDAREAAMRGWRTFRVKRPWESLLASEVYCPAERGKQCIDCGACNGSKVKIGETLRRSIAIDAHGGINVMRNFDLVQLSKD